MHRLFLIGRWLLASALIAAATWPAARAATLITFTETSVGGVDSLTVTGMSGIVVSGTANNWTVDFSGAGIYGLSPFAVLVWQEDPAGALYNVLRVTGNYTATFLSDVTLPADNNTAQLCGVGPALQLGASCGFGERVNPLFSDADPMFATVTERIAPASVPEPSGAALAALALAVAGAALKRPARR